MKTRDYYDILIYINSLYFKHIRFMIIWKKQQSRIDEGLDGEGGVQIPITINVRSSLRITITKNTIMVKKMHNAKLLYAECTWCVSVPGL